MTEENTLDESEVAPQEEETSQEQVVDTEESTSTPSEDVAETQEEERLLAGKYKNVEELEKGYKNLESALGQRQQTPPPPPPTEDELLQPLLREDGSVDPIKLMQQAENRAYERVQNTQRARDFERDDWNEALKAYPELADNKVLTDLIKSKRISMLTTGQGYMPYKDMAKEIVSAFASKEKEGREKGRDEAQISERIVERSALVEPNTNGGTGVTAEQELKKQMGSLDHEVARQARLKWLEKYNS